MPKTRKPVADYITFEQFQKMVADEPDPMWKLCYRFFWVFLTRVSELVGQSDADANQVKKSRVYRAEFVKAIMADPKKIKEYLKEHQKKPKVGDYKWVRQLPGVRPIDIDAISAAELGYDAQHTLRIWRKHGKFDVFPFSDEQLYADTMSYISWKGIKPEERLFPVFRQKVAKKMNRCGHTVGGMTKIHPHALRRGGGIYYRAQGILDIEDLQMIYNHEDMAQTMHYLGIDKRQAFKKFSKAQRFSNVREVQQKK